MNKSHLPPHGPERPVRPIGVSILSIWNGTTGGLLPLLALLGGFTRGDPQIGTGLPFAFSLVLASLILFTAIGTFIGNDRSRLGLILLVTIQQSTLAFNPLGKMAAGGLSSIELVSSYLRIGLSLFWILINAWYFLRPKTLKFYRFSRTRI